MKILNRVRGEWSPTCGHEEGDAELATEDTCPQIL